MLFLHLYFLGEEYFFILAASFFKKCGFSFVLELPFFNKYYFPDVFRLFFLFAFSAPFLPP